MIEAEAKTKWCPLARRFSTGDCSGGWNRHLGDAADFGKSDIPHCVGAACMAWRWSRARETASYLQAVQERMKSTGENFNVATNKVYAEIGSTFEKTEGYCGAFGEPK